MKRILSKITIKFLFALFLIPITQSSADTIILKNGKKIDFDEVWEEDDCIKAKRGRITIGFTKDEITEIVREERPEYDSFEFDVWHAGITIQEAFRVAELHDIPINKVGIVSGYKKFNQKVYDYFNSTNLFYYKTKLLGKHAQITLCFTPTSRFLHKIIINFTGNGSHTKEFENEILIMLKNKYGDKNRYGFKLLGNTRTWSMENKYKLVMTKMGSIKLEYIDNALEIQNTTEKKKIEDKKRAERLKKDGHKF